MDWLKENWFKLGLLAAIFLLIFRVSDIIYAQIQSIENLNPNVLVVLMLAASIIGWFVVFGLGLWQQRNQLRNEAKMKVYEELYSLKKVVDESGISLSALLRHSLLFLMMGFEGRKNSDKVEANSKALNIWQEHVSNLSKSIFDFTGAYLKLWVHSEMWMSAMPQLKSAKRELFENQLNVLTKKLHEHQNYLQNQSSKEWHWEEWDKIEIDRRAEEIAELFDRVAVGYLDDYIGLVHNRLVVSILGHKRKSRENFANLNKVSSYTILTEKGLKEVFPSQKSFKKN